VAYPITDLCESSLDFAVGSGFFRPFAESVSSLGGIVVAPFSWAAYVPRGDQAICSSYGVLSVYLSSGAKRFHGRCLFHELGSSLFERYFSRRCWQLPASDPAWSVMMVRRVWTSGRCFPLRSLLGVLPRFGGCRFLFRL